MKIGILTLDIDFYFFSDIILDNSFRKEPGYDCIRRENKP